MLVDIERMRTQYHLDDNSVDVLNFAEEEALGFNHLYVGTEHLLLSLIRSPHAELKQVLAGLEIDATKVRSRVDFILGRGEKPVLTNLELTPRARKVIELSYEEVKRMQQEITTPPFILLGIVREGEGIAAGLLVNWGGNLNKVRAIRRTIANPQPEPHQQPESLEDQVMYGLTNRFTDPRYPRDKKDLLAQTIKNLLDLTNPIGQES